MDLEIGHRIRTRRLELGMSQEAVADALGVTFQQLQKYEKGVNRVAATTLYRLAQVLETHTTALLPDETSKGRKTTLSSDARKIVEAYAQLAPSDQRAVMSSIASSLSSKASAEAPRKRTQKTTRG